MTKKADSPGLLDVAVHEKPKPERIPLGGLFESYEDSYADAWRALMTESRKMALPILYLQRHTFELIVKSILKCAIAERSARHELDELFGTASGPGPVAPTDFELVHTTHEFNRLFPRLAANLSSLGRPPLPEEFQTLRDLFVEVDEDRPDRLRFDMQFNRKKGIASSSFPRAWEGKGSKAAPCQEVAELLEKVLSARKRVIDHFVHEAPTLNTQLDLFFIDEYEAQLTIDGEVSARLGPMTKACREGLLHWTEVEPSDIRIEAPHVLESLVKDVGGGLVANFEGRPHILVWLRGIVQVVGNGGKRTEDAFFLATRRPNGTLTAGVWPDECQSNLVYEAIRCFRRDQGLEMS